MCPFVAIIYNRTLIPICRANEKGVYMSLLTDIYKVMSEAKPTDLYKDLEENEVINAISHLCKPDMDRPTILHTADIYSMAIHSDIFISADIMGMAR